MPNDIGANTWWLPGEDDGLPGLQGHGGLAAEAAEADADGAVAVTAPADDAGEAGSEPKADAPDDSAGEADLDLGAAAPPPAPEASPTASPSAERCTADGVPLSQILWDRPDVFVSFYERYFGDGNDRNSSAWADRVGGETPEDYANYWYETYGRDGGYQPGCGDVTSFIKDYCRQLNGGETAERTTSDGRSLVQVLCERPDVFFGFFREYYGPNNDHHSSAWVDRVGGETPVDYANYWYETYGWLDYLFGRYGALDRDDGAAPTEPSPPAQEPPLEPTPVQAEVDWFAGL